MLQKYKKTWENRAEGTKRRITYLVAEQSQKIDGGITTAVI